MVICVAVQFGDNKYDTDMWYFSSKLSNRPTVFTQTISVTKNINLHIQVSHKNTVTVEEERECCVRVSDPFGP